MNLNRLRDQQYLAYLDRHRAFVLEEAVKLDISGRGREHDVSKLTTEEFDPYAEYFYGGHERGNVPAEVQEAFDRAWLLHQKRNDHHWQYWVLREDNGDTKVLKMSEGAMRELVADWRGAGRAIMGDKADAGAWYLKNRERIMLHPETRAWVETELGVHKTEDLVTRGMTIVHRLQEKFAPCTANPHGETCCWHWRGQRPTLQIEVQADCCWCGRVATFGYRDIEAGTVPTSPSPGGVHGTRHSVAVPA